MNTNISNMTTSELNKLYTENKHFQMAFTALNNTKNKEVIDNLVIALITLHSNHVNERYKYIVNSSVKFDEFKKTMIKIAKSFNTKTKVEKPKSEWLNIKDQIILEFEKAEITDKVFMSKWMKLERLVNTCRNMIKRNDSWSKLVDSRPYYDAEMLLDDIRDNHYESYAKFSEVNGYNYGITHNIGSMIS